MVADLNSVHNWLVKGVAVALIVGGVIQVFPGGPGDDRQPYHVDNISLHSTVPIYMYNSVIFNIARYVAVG